MLNSSWRGVLLYLFFKLTLMFLMRMWIRKSYENMLKRKSAESPAV